MVTPVLREAPFGRVLTAMVTPFDASGEIDFDAVQKLATDLVNAGCDGLVINGTTGEAPTTSDAEPELSPVLVQTTPATRRTSPSRPSGSAPTVYSSLRRITTNPRKKDCSPISPRLLTPPNFR